MKELRKDPLQGRWVIIATESGGRPSSFALEVRRPIDGFCPLWEGNEDRTSSEIFSFRDRGAPSNSPSWSLRVVPNKFSALKIEGDLNREGDGLDNGYRGTNVYEGGKVIMPIEAKMVFITLIILISLWSFHGGKK